METSDVPQGLVLGPRLFHTFVSDMDSGIEAPSASLSSDTELGGVLNTGEGRDGIHRDLDRLERWDHANLREFSKAKCQVLHLHWGHPRHTPRLGREVIESSPVGKDSGVVADEKFTTSQQ